jgi:hypothetical protein
MNLTYGHFTQNIAKRYEILSCALNVFLAEQTNEMTRYMQMMRRTIVLFICMILCGVSVPSHAAEISCAAASSNGCYIGFLRGKISKGDYEKIATLLRANYSSIGTFGLVSPGGDVDEALKIGRLFRKYLLSTIAPLQLGDGDWSLYLGALMCRGQDCGTCASACALIWFGGVDREGTVGLHRPRINNPMFAGLSAPDASAAYRRVLERIAAYLDEMEVPKPIIESMVATGSSDIHLVDAWDDQLDRPPSIAEWEGASCGSDKLTPQQLAEFEQKRICVSNLLSGHRDRLGPP